MNINICMKWTTFIFVHLYLTVHLPHLSRIYYFFLHFPIIINGIHEKLRLRVLITYKINPALQNWPNNSETEFRFNYSAFYICYDVK